ncbi:YciI family protein [Demequina sp. NBRC 110055]|uniref:YciI family protein n=1 Tax=Demequina sp. NBRC 110055 TaxID=1570344 RepID=UPI000A01D867|nr:YciI family protein [Demequina sp. NBRC 110055]
MTKFAIMFPARALTATGDELAAIAASSRAVVRQAKEAGVWVFGGGVERAVAPTQVNADRTECEPYEETRALNGGITVLECATRDEALEWAARIAEGCGCPQDLVEFMYDPES